MTTPTPEKGRRRAVTSTPTRNRRPDAGLRRTAERLQQTEAALRLSDERLRSILANAEDVIYRRDLQADRYDCVSPSVEMLTGFTPDEFTSGGLATTLARVHPRDRARARADIQAVFASPTGRGHAEYRYRRKDGQYRWFADHFTVTRDAAGRPLYWVGTVRDVTDIKRAELALTRSRDQLEATVTERTAQLRRMTARLIAAEEAERERIGHVLHDDLQQILVGLRLALEARRQAGLRPRHAAAVLRLVEQAVQVTRSLSADLLPPNLLTEKLGEGLAWLAHDMKLRCGLTVRCDVAHAPEPHTHAVRAFAIRTVRELLLNIAKHAGTREAHLCIERAGRGQLRITLRDRGVGFDASRLNATGMSLFRIRERAAFFGGEFTVVSAPGTGTCATLILPLR